jgi:putative peptidoglycan lipid II flippase
MVATKVLLVVVSNAVYTVPHGVNAHLHPNLRAVEWLNIATSASYVVGAIAGHVLLTRRLGLLGFRAVLATVLRVAIAAVVGAVAAYAVVLGCNHALSDGRAGAVTGLLGGGIVGLAVFVGVAWRMRIAEIRDLARMVRGA